MAHVANAQPQRNQTAPAGRRRRRRPLARGVRALPAHASATWPRTASSPTSATCGGSSIGSAAGGSPGLTISELSDYPAWLTAQELAPASISRHVVSLKVFFRYLQLEGVLTDNQAELLGTQKLWQRVPTVLSQTEIDALLTAPRPPRPWWRRDRAMLELLYATGCRVSELSILRPRDVHLAERYCLCHGKGDKQRVVPLGAKAVAAVEAYLRTRAAETRRPRRARPRSSCCSPRAAAGCAASGSGN